MDLDFGNMTLAEHKAPAAGVPKEVKADKMPKDNPLSDVDSEADKMPEATKVDPVPDVDSETPEVEAAEDDRDGELYWPGQKVVKMPADPNAEEIASKRLVPFNKVRPKENVVVVLPKAFDPYKFVPYVYKYDSDEDDCYIDDNDRAAFELYRKEHFETQGFDVEHFYDDIIGALKSLEDMDNTGMVGSDCVPTVVKAIKYYNMARNENLEFEKMIKCNYVRGTRYYATFRAKDTVTGAIGTYQAEVGCNHFTGRITIHKFRPKPDSVPEAKN